jgi:hypothetical protein
MNDRLPYEEQLAQQWNDLPLPDENMAWEDMKRRLEDDDDGGIIPIWLRGCGLWGLLAVVILGLGWWLIRPEKWWNKEQETENVKAINQKAGNHNNRIKADDTIQVIKSADTEKQTGNTGDILKNSSADSSLTRLDTRQKKTVLIKNVDDISVLVSNAQSKRKETSSKQQTAKSGTEKNKRANNKKNQKQTESEQLTISIQQGATNKETGNDLVKVKINPVLAAKDSMDVTTVNTNKTDSVHKIPPDSIQKKAGEQTVKTNQQKKDSSNPKTISFSAGLAMHQLLPVGGQKLTPYNSLGRKASLADYIPSVYGRMYKNGKWFLQMEFRYGAPQYTKEFLYAQQSKLDSVGPLSFTTTTSSKLKKTFYHQLPVTFNYFVLPGWSIGTGIVWNKFVSAISQQEVIRRNNITQQDSLVSNGITSDKNNSAFAKSYFQAVFETQYRWRRFSLGARYSFGLQPYIKFTLPRSVQQEERNRSLQVFLRYELWKSKATR